MTPTKTVLTATINGVIENVVSAVYGGQITIKSPQIYCNNTLDFGAVSVTEPCEKALTVNNYGNAPLTISRVTFNNESMSVKEELPIVIDSWNNKSLTLVYSGVEQTSFEGTMNIYSNDPDQRMKTVTVTGSRFAPNYMSAMGTNVLTDQNVRLSLAVDNYDPITGLQFDVVCPSVYQGGAGYQLEARAEGMSVTTVQTGTNTWQYYCYFLDGSSIAAGSGKVMKLQLKPVGGSAPVGKYTISIKNIKMGTADLQNKYAGGDLQCVVSVFDAKKIDANGDGKMDINDAICIVNYLMGNPPAGFNAAAADVNGDGQVTIADAVIVVNIIMN